jgi:hypothetical protein
MEYKLGPSCGSVYHRIFSITWRKGVRHIEISLSQGGLYRSCYWPVLFLLFNCALYESFADHNEGDTSLSPFSLVCCITEGRYSCSYIMHAKAHEQKGVGDLKKKTHVQE